MGLFKKGTKVAGVDMKAELSMLCKQTEKREQRLQEKADKVRKEAKQALASGDERMYNRQARRYGMTMPQLETTQKMGDVIYYMQDAIEAQEHIKDMEEVSHKVGQYQKQLGIDDENLKNAAKTLSVAAQKMQTQVETVNNIADSIVTGSSTQYADSLRAELMTEIKSEGGEIGLAERIKKAERI